MKRLLERKLENLFAEVMEGEESIKFIFDGKERGAT